LKKRRNTKKKPKSIISSEVNLTNLDTYLQSNAFRITSNERRKDLIKRIEDISDLLTQLLLLKNREVVIKDIYEETFKKYDKLNKNMIELESLVHKKTKLNNKTIEKIKLVESRTTLGDNIHTIHNNLRERIFKIEDEFYNKIKTGNSSTDDILKTILRNSLYIYIDDKNKKDINLLTKSQQDKFQRERNEFNESIEAVMNINREVLDLEDTIKNNERAIEVSEGLLKNPTFTSRNNAVQKLKEKIAHLKQDKAELDKRYLVIYRNKTSAIRDIITGLNKKYDNPYIIDAIVGPMAEEQKRLKSFSLISNLNPLLGATSTFTEV
jgi:hypothetical protein